MERLLQLLLLQVEWG